MADQMQIKRPKIVLYSLETTSDVMSSQRKLSKSPLKQSKTMVRT